MTNSVDDEIVSMKFDNKQFMPAVQATLGALGKLKQAISFGGKKNGIDDIQASANKFSMGDVDKELQKSTSHWSAWRTAGLIAFATVVHQAVRAGERVLASFTIDPIKAGFESYETQINATQTILANTGAKLKPVSQSLKQLQDYANQTVYSFADMTQNIGTFTAAGVKLKPAVQDIKGIANVAALSGSTSQQASTAMYQLSQAVAAGSVKLQDWNSVVNAGMGGKNFQNALEASARSMGTNVDAMVKKAGSFRESLQSGWITGDVLNKTLKIMSGRFNEAKGTTVAYTAAQIKAMGYSEKDAEQLSKLSQSAIDSATHIKTITQLTDALKEEVATAYATIFKTLLGNINGATSLLTSVHNVLENWLTTPIYQLNSFIKAFAKLGGRDVIIDTIADAFDALGAIIKPIKDAFHEIFPPASAASMLSFAKAIENLVENLYIGDTAAANLKRTFAGVFAVFDIGWQVVKGLAQVFEALFFSATDSSGGILVFTGRIGDFLVALDKAIKNGDGLTEFFQGLYNVLSVPVKILGVVTTLIANLFDGLTGGAAASASATLNRVGQRLSPLQAIAGAVKKAFEGLSEAFASVDKFIQPFLDDLGNAFSGLGDAIAQGLQSGSFDAVFDALNTGLFAALILMVKKFFSGGGAFSAAVNIDPTGGMFSAIKKSFGGLTETMEAMQTQLKAKTLLDIAAAIGILTASVVALSLINSKKLTSALAAMAVGFGELLGAMAILVKISGSAGFVKIPAMALSMDLLAGSLLILTAAVALMAQLGWSEIAKGLAGVGGAMVILIGAMAIMPEKRMLSMSLGLDAVAVAMNIMAGALAIIGHMSWDSIAKGLVGLGGALTELAIALNTMDGAIPGALALAVVTPGLLALSGTMAVLGTLSWVAIAKGMVALGGALVELAVGLTAMIAALPGAAALDVASVGLLAIAGVLAVMGTLSWQAIGKGMVAIGGALLILAIGLTAMIAALPGALALTVASAGLIAISGALVLLGEMSWDAILKGLVTLAGAITILGVAGAILSPLSLGFLALGASIALFGAGLALAGAGVLAFATAFSVLAAAGSVGVAVMTSMLTHIISLIPQALTAFAVGIISFAKTIATGGPAFIAAFTTIIDSLLTSVTKAIPKIGNLFTTLIQTAAKVVRKNAPTVINTGLDLIVDFLSAIRNHIGPITTIAVSIIIKFIGALGDNAGRIADAGAKLIIKLMNGMSKAIDNNSAAMGKAGADLGISIAKGMITGLGSMVKEVVDKAAGLAKSAIGAIHKFIKNPPFPSREGIKLGYSLGYGFGAGITSATKPVVDSATDVASTAVATLREAMSKNLPDAMPDDTLNPVIAPVLDLTQFRKDAAGISSSLPTAPIPATVSLNAANDISAARDAQETAASTTQPVAPTINISQTNNSPKALSTIEIYRQTKNLMSQAKQALSVA